MPGSTSVPHWFRRALSLLNTEIQTTSLRGTAFVAGTSAATAGGRRPAPQDLREERRAPAQQVAAPRAGRRRQGPQELEAIVASWEAQQARKALAASRRKSGRR